MHPGGRALLALWLVAAAVLSGPAAGAAPARPPSPRTGSAVVQQAPQPTCAVPTDCRLWEAARTAGVRFGLATSTGTDLHRQVLAREANVVVNHQFSWSGIEPQRGVWDFTKADAEYQFALDHGMYQIAMHFAWDQVVLDDMPDWVAQITDPVELRAVLTERAQVIFARYPKLDRIDVVNEPFDTLGSNLVHNHFYDVLGPDYIDQLFTIVEAAAPPTTELFVNEGGIEYQPAKAASLVALVGDLRARGHRVDAVGLQSHMDVGEPNWAVLLDTMQRLAALGTTPFISELDIPVPPIVADRAVVQADRYRTTTEICLMVPACDVIDLWGVGDAESWLNGSLYPGLEPLLLDDAYQPKQAYVAVRDALLAGRIPPRSFPAVTPTPITGGQAQVTYHYECAAGPDVVDHGIPQIFPVVHTFMSGNPVRLDVPATLTWDPNAAPDGTVHHHTTLQVDLATLATRYNEETARPAVGLGGHHDLVGTVWLRLSAENLAVAADPPPGTGGTGRANQAGPLVGDSRTPGPPATVELDWTTVTPPAATALTAGFGPPALHFDLTTDLGVVFSGVPVSGGVHATVSCTAVAEVPVAVAAVAPATVPPTTVPTTTASTTATSSVANRSTSQSTANAAVVARPAFTG